MKRLSHIPHALKQGFVDGQKPDHFYGTEKGLAQSRKKSALKTQQRWTVLNALKRIGL